MLRKPRLFSRELIHKVNQNMIDGNPPDTSRLPADMVAMIRETRYNREEIAAAWRNVFANRAFYNLNARK
jgi:hypothetical protein